MSSSGLGSGQWSPDLAIQGPPHDILLVVVLDPPLNRQSRCTPRMDTTLNAKRLPWEIAIQAAAGHSGPPVSCPAT